MENCDTRVGVGELGDRCESYRATAGQRVHPTTRGDVEGLVDGMLEHRHLILWVDALPESPVHQHDVGGEGEHHHLRCAPAGGEIGGEKPGFAFTGVGEHLLFDLHGRRPGQRKQEGTALFDPPGEVEGTDDAAGEGISDGHPGATELREASGVVFGTRDEGRLPGLERGSDPVGAGVFLAVAVAGGEGHLVEPAEEFAAAGCAREHHAVRRGEDDAHGFGRQVGGKLIENRLGCGHQRAVGVRLPHERELQAVGLDLERPGSAPRGGDRIADGVVEATVPGIVGTEELLASPGHVGDGFTRAGCNWLGLHRDCNSLL